MQPTAINTIGMFGKKSCRILGTRHCCSYTGHCFRRTMIVLFVDAGGDVLKLKKHGGWRSAVAEVQ